VPAVDIATGRIVVALLEAGSETLLPLRVRSTAKRSGGG